MSYGFSERIKINHHSCSFSTFHLNRYILQMQSTFERKENTKDECNIRFEDEKKTIEEEQRAW